MEDNTAQTLQCDAWTYLDWCEHALLEDYRAEVASEAENAGDSLPTDSEYFGEHYLQGCWDDFLEDFNRILRTISPEGCYHVEGRNLGWRHLSGEADINASDPQEFISKIFPKTSDWTLNGKYDIEANCLEFSLYHHDAPTGESYSVTAASGEEP